MTRLKAPNRQQILKLEVLRHYSSTKTGLPVCARCGNDDLRALSIDHINGGGGRHIAEIHGNLYSWLKRQDYPDGFQVLCMNCQWIKRAENNENPNRTHRHLKDLPYGKVVISGMDLALYGQAKNIAAGYGMTVSQWFNQVIPTHLADAPKPLPVSQMQRDKLLLRYLKTKRFLGINILYIATVKNKVWAKAVMVGSNIKKAILPSITKTAGIIAKIKSLKLRLNFARPTTAPTEVPVSPSLEIPAIITDSETPACPDCQQPMRKAGFGPSGKKMVQMWRCTNKECPRYLTRTTKH